MIATGREALERVVLVLVCLAFAAGGIAAYGWRAMTSSEQVANRASAALQDESVRRVVAERVTDELVRARPELLAARPVVVSAVSGVVGGDAFASLFRSAARDAHRAVFRREQDTVALTLVDTGIVVAAALQELAPSLASELEAGERTVVLRRDAGVVVDGLTGLARKLGLLALGLAIVGLAAVGAALRLSADRRRTVSRLGIALAIAGVMIVALAAATRALLLDRLSEPDAREAVGAVWDAFLGDLRTVGWLIAGSGAVLAAAAASLIQPVGVERALAAGWRRVRTEPSNGPARAARGAALIAGGLSLLAYPGVALRVAATVAGVYVLYKGFEAILRLINPPGRAASATRGSAPRLPSRTRLRRLAVAIVAGLALAAGLGAFVASGGASEAAPVITRCNGSAALCDRPLDEVVLPATHNSMSVPLPGWFASLQERPIGEQLEDGIRGLLLDTHYADRLSNGRVRTHFASAADFRRAIRQDAVSDGGVEAAERLRGRLGFRGSGERGIYLCHTFCELGSTPLAGVLEDIHAFLVTHPADVVVVVNQDHVAPADFVGAVEAAGLAPYALEPPRRSPWPTLGELIQRNRRLVVLAENRAGAAPWYRPAFDGVLQDTPFTFGGAPELAAPDRLPASCERNRGVERAPLLLLNHWINTDPVPRPGNASAVNAYDALLRRARVCADIRGRGINLLAVDFYRRGDVFAVAEALNGD